MRRPGLWVLAGVAWYLVLVTVLWTWPPAGDDAYAHSIMAVEQVKCWRHGVIWPRFHPDWNGGTGSFLPSVYAPVTLGAEGLACAVSGEGTRAVGVVLVGGLALGALLLAGSLKARGLTGGLFWMVAAYPLAAVLARATTTEVMALAMAGPVLVLGLPPGTRSRAQGVALGAAVALASGCQVGMVLMIGMVLAATWLVARGSWGWEGVRTGAWFGAGTLLGGVFWWPAVHDFAWMARDALLRGEYDWRSHHALAVSANAELGPFLLACFGSLLVVAFVIMRGTSGREERWPVVAGLGWALVLAVPLSFPVWRVLPVMAALQFPWRFLGLATILGIIGAGLLEDRYRNVILLLLIVPGALIPVELAGPAPALTPNLDGAELASASSVRYGIAPVLPSMPGFYARHFNAITSLRKLRLQKSTVTRRSGGCRFPQVFDVISGGNEAVLLPLQWWPELEVRMGGRTLGYENREGLVTVRLAAGQHRLTVTLLPSRSRRIGALISLAGLLVAGVLWIVWGKQEEAGGGDARGDSGPGARRPD